MAWIAAVSTLFFIVTGAVVGFRLLLLGARGGGLPEWSVGTSLFVMSGIAYPLLIAARQTDAVTASWLSALGSFGLAVGWSGAIFFVWRVFRSDAAWAAGLAGALILTLYVSAFAAGWNAFQVPREALFVPTLASQTLIAVGIACYLWMGTEALNYRAQLVKRMALGLADPILVNRFALWAGVAGAALVSVVPSFIVGAMGGDTQGPWLQVCTSVNGLATSVLLVLVFMPPQRYTAAVARRAAAASAEG